MRQKSFPPIYLFSLAFFLLERALLPVWGWQLHISLAMVFLLVAWLVEVGRLGNAPVAELWNRRLLPQCLLIMFFDLWSGGYWGSGLAAWLVTLALFALWRAWLLNNSGRWWYSVILGGVLYNFYRLLQIVLDWLIKRPDYLSRYWPELLSWQSQLEVFGFVLVSLLFVFYVQKKILHS